MGRLVRLIARGVFSILALVIPFVALSAVLSVPLDAQVPVNTWQSIGPSNIGGPVSDLLIDPADPNVLIISTDGGGLWRSTNGGASWQAIDLALPTLSVRALARNPVQPAVIFATTDLGLLRSTDRGLTWRTVSSFPSSRARRVAVSGDGQLVIVSVDGFWRVPGLYQSFDGGASWAAVSSGGGGPLEVAFSPVYPRRGVAFARDSNFFCYIYMFSTAGLQSRMLPGCVERVAFATDDPDVAYFGSGMTIGRYQMTDTQQTLVASGSIGSDTSISALWVDPTNSNTVVVGARDLWRSTDGGMTFTQISDWSQHTWLPGGRQYTIRSDPGFNGTSNRRVYVGTSTGLFRTDDIYAATATTGWTALNTGLKVSSFQSAAFASDGAVLALDRNQAVIRMAPGSSTASRATTSATFREPFAAKPRSLVIDPTNPLLVYAADVGASTLSRSTDGGLTFTAMTGPQTTRPMRLLLGDPQDGNRLYVFYATENAAELFRTSNARAATPSWELLPSDGFRTFFDAAFAPGSSSTLWMSEGFFSTTGSKLSKSTNANAAAPAFTPMGPNVAPGSFHAEHLTIATIDGQVGYVRGQEYPNSGIAASMWRTSDGGATWSRKADVGATVNFLTTHPSNPDWVLAATEQGVYQSSDGAATWTLAFPARAAVSSLAWRGTTLLAATEGLGLWTIDLPGQPMIAVPPVNQFVVAGANAAFTVWAAGAPAVTYRWQISTDGGSSWTDLADTAPYSGVTTATLTVAAASVAQSGTQYRSIISNNLGTVTSAAVTLSVAGPTLAIAAGAIHTCVLNSRGGVECWGHNAHGQLGDGSTVNRVVPQAVNGLTEQATALALGDGFSCALTTAGGVACWGRNYSGQLGDGSTTNRLTPVAVTGLPGAVAIDAGFDYACAVTHGGGLACWGGNAYGQLGDGTYTQRSTPVPVSALTSGVRSVATSVKHTCALTTTGGVMCWGDNEGGQLGDGTTTSRLVPAGVTGLSNGVVAITAGWNHTCALTSAGSVVCWGAGRFHELGDGGGVHRSLPVGVHGLSSGVVAIAAGGQHTCALTSGGAVRCWGHNYVGLGDGTDTKTSFMPVTVSGLSSGATAITAGNYHDCAVVAGGVMCWGLNDYGQLGDGTLTIRTRPVAVNLGLVAAPGRLQFTATKNGSFFGSVTPAQTVSVAILGAASTWSASADQPWVQLTGASGTGSGLLTVTMINPNDVVGTATSLTATITIISTTLDLPALATLSVSLTVVPAASGTAPFGIFDTPATGATVAGSIAVTGWALDDQSVSRVEIWRDLVAGETTTPYQGAGPGNGKVFIANAAFVSGARPDVEQAYATYPQSSRAGWGYLLLTQGLWNQGNGTYTLHAFAYDQPGNSTTLGSKTITSNNATSVKPFGAIDTPTNGQTVTTSFWNFGWALTPNATPSCQIGPAGVQVSIDSGPLAPVTYGDLRTDIGAAFPGFSNSGGAGGAYYIDTTVLSNGTHQIGWLVTDSCGRAEGIGSRFFTVLNGSGRMAADEPPADHVDNDVASGFSRLLAAPVDLSAVALAEVELRRGAETSLVMPNPSGRRVVSIAQGERVEVQLPAGGVFTGYQVVGGERRALPVGSSFDAAQGIFYWQPGPGFLGAHDLEFESPRAGIVQVRAVIGTAVQAVIDSPQPGPVASSFVVAGWAIDEATRHGSGIDTVHVWAHPTSGAPPQFLGVADYGGPRTDIAALFGDPFIGAGYGLQVNGLAPGDYDIVVYPHSAVTGDFHWARAVRVSVPE